MGPADNESVALGQIWSQVGTNQTPAQSLPSFSFGLIRATIKLASPKSHSFLLTHEISLEILDMFCYSSQPISLVTRMEKSKIDI